MIRYQAALGTLRAELGALANRAIGNDVSQFFSRALDEFQRNPSGGIDGAINKALDQAAAEKSQEFLRITRAVQKALQAFAGLRSLDVRTTDPTQPDLLKRGTVTLRLENFREPDRGTPALVRVAERLVYRNNRPPSDRASVATITLVQPLPMRRVRYASIPRHRDTYDPDSNVYARNQRRVPIDSAVVQGDYRLHGNYGLVELEVIFACRQPPGELPGDNLSIRRVQLPVSGETEQQVVARARSIDESTLNEIADIRQLIEEIKLLETAVGRLAGAIPLVGSSFKGVIDAAIDAFELAYLQFEGKWKRAALQILRARG